MTCDESWIYCYDTETKRQSSQWKHAGSPRPKEARVSKSTHKLLMIPLLTTLAWSTCTGFPLDRQLTKEYYVEVLREFRKRLTLCKLGQWHFHQDNAPVYNSILVTDYLTKMGIKTIPHPPYSPDVCPCDFWLFPKLRSCRYERIEMKEAMTKVIDTLTRELPWGLLEVVGTVQEVHRSRRRLLGRGLEFHACAINISAHTKKVWKLI